MQVEWGVAHARRLFSEGAERVVFQCTEVVSVDGGATAYAIGPRLVAKQTRHQERVHDPKFHRTFCRTQGAWYGMRRNNACLLIRVHASAAIRRIVSCTVCGACLACLSGPLFPVLTTTTPPSPPSNAPAPGEAAELASLFNRRLRGGPAWQVHFLPCYVYKIADGYYSYGSGGVMEVLVEEELEGKFTKW